MLLKKTFLISAFIFSFCAVSQNKVNYGLYNNNLNLINPAFAGQADNTSILINSKTQWVGVTDAPKTSTVSLNIPLKENIGIALNIINDKIFVFNQTQISLDASYKLKVSRDHDISFGIKAQANLYSGEFNTIKTAAENDAFFAESVHNFSPNFSMGAALIHDDYYLHATLNTLLIDQRYKDLNTSKNKSKLHMNIGGGYTIKLNNYLNLTPSTLLTVIEGAPLSIDANTTLEINEKYDVGLSYSFNNSMQINTKITATNWFDIGYGYSIYTNKISPYQNGTHEFFALFNLDDIF
ncbi:type IX secretion system membrane protein PorP/SprF [Tenacibaculum finnmarkense]|nr:type IX secretion system membrane protein PorP/SprF [Tenacibaculum finnmarkense]